MGFDVEGARKAGYSDGEIADFLGDEQKFDVQGARKAGYNDTEILGELLTTVGRVPLPEGVKPSNAGGGRGSINPPTPQPGIVDRAVAGIKSLLAPSDPGLNTQNGDGSIFDKPAPPELQNRPPPAGGTAQPGPTIADPTGRAAAEAQAIQDSRAPWAVQAEREAAQRRYEVNRGISNAPVLGEDTGPTVGERVQAALQPKPMQENSLAGVAQSAAAGAARSGVEKVQDISVASTRAIYSVPKLLADASQLVTGGATAPISDLFGAMDEAGKKLASQHHQTVQRELDQVMNDPKAGIADVIGVLVRNPGYAAVEALASGGGSVALSVGASRVFSNVAGRFAASRGLSETATRAAQARAAEAGVEAMNIAMNAGGTFAETKGSLTDKYTAAAIAGVATKAAGKAFDGGAEGTLVRGGVGDTRVGRAVTGALKEGAQESYEQAGQQLGQAVGEGRPNDIGDAKQIVLGGALGAPLGGAAGAVSRRRDSPAAPVAPAAPATPRVEEMPTTPISPEEIRQRAPAAPVAPAPVVSTPTPGADIGVAAVPQGALAARAEQALKDANVSPENGPAQVVAPSGQRPDSGAPGGVGDVRPATPGGGRVGDDPGGSVAPGAAAQPVASPSAPDLALKPEPPAPAPTPAPANTKPVEDFLKIDPKKFAPRDPGVEVSDAPVQKGKPKGFDKSTAEDVKLADPDKIVTPKPSTDGFPTRESAVQFLKDTGLNEKFHVGNPSEDGTVFVIPFPTAAKKPTLHDKRTLDMTEEWLKVAPDSKVRPPKLVMTKIDTIEKSMVASVAEVVHTAFGIRVNLVDNLAERGVNGIAVHGTNDKSKRFSHVFVDAKVPDFVQTIGHEATHVLEKTSPDLYARLQEVILASRSKVGHTGYLSERMPLYKGRKLRADGKENITKTMNDEFTADVSGAMWRDPQFWQRVYELDSGSTFRKLMYQFMKALNKVLNVARARRIDVTKLVKDIDQVRETAAQVWAERAQRNAAAPKAASKGGTVDGVKEQAVWHGTPHRGIDKFSTDKIGTGEGAQAYGWGLYFASKRAIAEHYRKVLSGSEGAAWTKDGKTIVGDAVLAEYFKPGRLVPSFGGMDKVLEFDPRDGGRSFGVKVVSVKNNGDEKPYERPRWHSTYPDVRELKSVLEKDGWTKGEAGQLYEVEIPEDSEMLLWDRALSEQPAHIQGPLAEVLQPEVDRRNAKREEMNAANPARLTHPVVGKIASRPWTADQMKGSDIYQLLAAEKGGPEASQFLYEHGIKGIKYLDGTSRAAGDGTYNYVIFNGDDTQIKGVQYQAASRDELYSNLAQDKAEPYKPTIPALRKEHAALRALLDCLRG